MLHMYADGGIMPEQTARKLCGVAYAFRIVNPDGGILVREFSCFCPWKASNNVAEILAVIAGLRSCVNTFHEQNVVVHSDSKVALSWLMNPNPDTSRGGALKYKRVMEWLDWADRVRTARVITIRETRLLKGHPTIADFRRGWGVRRRGGSPMSVSRHQQWCHDACDRAKAKYLARVRRAYAMSPVGEYAKAEVIQKERLVVDDYRIAVRGFPATTSTVPSESTCRSNSPTG